jgi:hypothetical protein
MDVEGCIKILAELQNNSGWKDIAGVAIGLIALGVSVASIRYSYLTAQRQQTTASAALLTTLTQTYNSLEMRKLRMDFARALATPDNRKTIDLYEFDSVLDFYEEIGYLVKRGILDKGMVWNHFFWHIERYYEAVTESRDLLDRARKKHKFPTLYSEFEWLNTELQKKHEKETKRKYEPPNKKAVESFLTSERGLIPPKIGTH